LQCDWQELAQRVIGKRSFTVIGKSFFLSSLFHRSHANRRALALKKLD
jgi:hypothetical protein